MSPWQIAIETSCRQGSIALLWQDRTIRQIVLPEDQRTAQALAPALRELLDLRRQESASDQPDAVPGGTGPADGSPLGLVSVGIGPGSFTGLRIGVTAAKTLAYAVGCRVAPCDPLAAMIERMRSDAPEHSGYDAAINAYRGQVFWRRESAGGDQEISTCVVDRGQWQARAAESGVLYAGDVWRSRDLEPLVEAGTLAPQTYWMPRAVEIGRLGWQTAVRDGLTDPLNLVPRYLRRSAAEEQWARADKRPAQRKSSPD